MTFYKTVLKEFKNGNDSYICHGSLTFEKAWKGETKRLKIIRDAEKFLEATGQMDCFGGYSLDYGSSLFRSAHWSERHLRIEFLEWCIKNNLDLK